MKTYPILPTAILPGWTVSSWFVRVEPGDPVFHWLYVWAGLSWYGRGRRSIPLVVVRNITTFPWPEFGRFDPNARRPYPFAAAGRAIAYNRFGFLVWASRPGWVMFH